MGQTQKPHPVKKPKKGFLPVGELPGGIHVTFTSDNGLQITALRGEGPPQLSGGYGGWEVVARPHKISVTNWIGRDPVRCAVPMLFDGWRGQVSVEPDLATLHRMGQPDADGAPPTIRCSGGIPRKDIRDWVIESLDWGTNVIWGFLHDGSAVRMRQDVTVNLLQYVDDDRAQLGGQTLKYTPPRPKGMPKPKHQFHVVKKGDTMAKISVAEYKSAKWVKEICKANKINDPKVIVTQFKKWKGKQLRMP